VFASLTHVARRALSTSNSAAPTVARVALGLILFPHGAQHALGWFGGYGFAGTLGWMTGTLGFPAPLAALGIITELVAQVLLRTRSGWALRPAEKRGRIRRSSYHAAVAAPGWLSN
jgi:hypothetical protein